MTLIMSKFEVLKLYKLMLKESKKIPTYNFREYAIRRIRDGFKTNKTVTGPEVQVIIQAAQKDLELIKRQAIIGQLYSTEKLVIEHQLQHQIK